MTLILSGTNGLSDVDGSASTPAIRGTDTNTGIFFPAADTIAFAEGGAEAMRIDSAGNLLVGATSNTDQSGTFGQTIRGPAPGLTFVGTEASARTYTIYEDTGSLRIYDRNAAAERARIDSSGRLLVNTTSPITSAYRVNIGSSSTTGNSLALQNNGTENLNLLFAGNGLTSQGVGVTTASRIYVYSNIDTSTGVYLTSGGTSWTSTSDERLKENLVEISDAAQKVGTLRAVVGNYIADKDKKRTPFLISQDVQAVFPEAVDASDPDQLGLSYTGMVPLLVAAIKEQQGMIQELKAEVDALKARLGAQA